MARASEINGKVIVVTGGARGIGLATAKMLHRLGAKVAIGDIDEATVKEAGADLDLGFYARLDVTDRQSFTTFLDDVERELGPVDVLVNNAGICPTGRFLEGPDEVTERTIAINATGVSLIEKPKPRLIVTRQASVMMAITSRLPRRLSEAMTRAMNADRIFADAVDKPERRDYEDRARHS
jgi:NAD(P)-dependent dehydrogenase (short-subunit alcohol dehydrogenase family)